MYFTVEKIENQLEEIKNTIYKQTKPITNFKYKETKFGEEPKNAHDPNYDDSSWDDFTVGESWGGYDKGAWFRTKVHIPKEWKDEKIVLHFLVGPRDGGGSTAETLLYVNGDPIQGIDVWHEEAWIPPEYLDDEEISISLKAWSGVLDVPDRRRFKVARLALVDQATEKYYFLVDTVLKALKELDENDLRRINFLQALNESFLKIDFLKIGSDLYYTSIGQALNHLEEKIETMSDVEEIKPKVTAVGHSHIDMAWLWTLDHSREKVSRTFSTVLHLMRQYPEYRYLHTSPQLYKYLKQDYPDIYAKVKERILAGDWEITGGMWIEPDTNVPNGESLIRQILFGKRFMRDEFDVETNVVWLPDVFGYSWALPQIMKKSGIERFMTTKISWNQYNRFPYDTFYWTGIDGTKILTHFITTPEQDSKIYTYNGMVEPYSVKGVWDSYRQKDINDELLIAFGWGDGGGGPTKEMIKSARVMKNLPGIPTVEMGSAETYFERLEKSIEGKNVPTWDGELYLEYHRGTYTSQASLKRANRKSEVIFHNAEWLSSLSHLLGQSKSYPHERLNSGWELLLLNQFHDILPGTSIRQVNEQARADYMKVKEIGNEVVQQAMNVISGNIQTNQDSIVVFNTLPYTRSGLIELPISDVVTENMTIQDDQGKLSASQVVDSENGKKVLVEAAHVPAQGYQTYSLVKGEEISSDLIIKEDQLENNFYQLKLSENGHLSSIYDKRHHREVLSSGEFGNVFQAFEDKPMKFDAWDIDIYYTEKMREVNELIERKVIEEGPLRGTLQLKWKFFDSIITQKMTIYKNSPRIDFKTEVDWQEKQTLLKVAFPVNIRSTKATYDIQFGTIERPTHWNTSWDYARFEVPGQKWVDLSEGNYGVALLNDCKYGYDVKDHIMRLTLIKSSIDPDETADRGKHQFTYSLVPHEGDWRVGNIIEEGYNLNNTLEFTSHSRNEQGNLPTSYQFLELDSEHVFVETIKKAEDDDALIIRLYETSQYRNSAVTIKFAQKIHQAMECNLVEENEEIIAHEDNQMTFSVDPYEIKTFKVYFE